MTSTTKDVKSIIDKQAMTSVQYATILLCFALNMLDGMDVLVISFSAKAISTAWEISPQTLGVVFSAAVVGMTIGALVIAPQADRLGRKTIILVSALTMGVSIFATSYAQSVSQLMIWRFVSGLGIGSMLAGISALASEYAPERSKDFWVTLVMGGYPVGATLSGLAAAEIIPEYGWRTMFRFAGLVTLALTPLVFFFLSESLEYLVKRRPRNALVRINTILAKMHLSPLDRLPPFEEQVRAASVSALFQGERKRETILTWISFFMAFATLYFLLTWTPRLTTVAGLSEKLGIYAGTVFNAGSFAGIVLAGGLALRWGLRRMIAMFMLLAALLMMLFGLFTGSAMVLVMFGMVGFAVQGGFNPLYPVAARLYPPEIRTTGIGWAIGAGRLGAVLGPIFAGFLIGAGFSLTASFMVFAVPCLICAATIVSIRSQNVS